MKFAREILFAVLVGSLCAIDAFAPASFGVARRATSGPTLASSESSPALQRQSSTCRRLAIDDDEDDEDDDDLDDLEPLAEGIDSVSWLPTVLGGKGDGETLTRKGSELIPLFPLGGIVYTPNSEHTLNIFEPRYREMYNDILMNGTKRFAVSMSHPTESGRFAQMAVLFELEDLKEVSEQTGDQIKYICNHKVTGRVKLHRILNPEVWESRATYLRAEGTVIDDSGKDAATVEQENSREQKLLRGAFEDLVELQHQLEEDVRFTRASVLSLAVDPGSGADGLWQTIKLWQSFADQRLMARQNELQRDFQEKLQEYLKKEKGLKGEELPRYAWIGGGTLLLHLQYLTDLISSSFSSTVAR
jgi:Lon protease-like protein